MMESCPSCGEGAAGRFCSHCGAAVAAECSDCGNPLPSGARFCNQCGHSTAGGGTAAPARGANLPWIVAGLALAALAGVLLLPRLRGAPEPPLTAASAAVAPAAPFAGPAGGNPRAVDLGSMSPREAADRLFNRVMQNVSAGDTAQARGFLPMAIAAYGRVPELDRDGHYHLAILHLVEGDAAAARSEADSVLAGEPRHLFGLFSAAQAEGLAGKRKEERALYQRFLDSYDAEVARGLPEYEEHAQALPPMKQAAQKVVAGQ